MTFPKLYGRLMIAIPGMALFLFILFFTDSHWSLLLFSVLSLLAAWEAVTLCCTSGVPILPGVFTSFFAGVSTLLIAVDHVLAFPSLLLPGTVLAVSIMTASGPDHARRRIAGTACLVSLYSIGFGLLGRMFLLGGPWLVLAVLALCWLGDSTAYFTGIAFGKHKLLPKVSPKKSWEGFYGGLVGAIAGCAAAGTLGGYKLIPLLLMGFFGGLAGVLGDLFESALKRDAGVKDSSGLLLGHGGILDRFDSAVAAAPAVYVVLVLFGLLS